jgi:hypothetical protein
MEESSSLIDIVLYLGYFLVAVAVVAAIVLPLIKSFDNPKSLAAMGAGLLGLAVIFIIAYLLSDSTVLPSYAKFDITEQGSKLIGASLIMMYLLVGISIIAIAFNEISKIFK